VLAVISFTLFVRDRKSQYAQTKNLVSNTGNAAEMLQYAYIFQPISFLGRKVD